MVRRGDFDEPDQGEEPDKLDVIGMRRFPMGEVMPWPERRKKEFAIGR